MSLRRRADTSCSEPNQQYWTCLTTSQTFAGCCIGDPCRNDGVCPDSLSSTTITAASSQTTPATSQTTPARTISANNVLTRDPTQWFQTATSTATATTTSTPHATPSPPNTGAIVGGLIGGVALLLILGALWYLLRLRRREKSSLPTSLSPESLPLKHARSSSAGSNPSVYSPTPLYSPVPPSAVWKSPALSDYPTTPYLDTPPMKLGYAQSQPQQEYAELPTAMLEPVELSTSDADTPGSPFLEKSFRFGSSIDGGAHDQWAGGRSGSGSGGGWGHR